MSSDKHADQNLSKLKVMCRWILDQLCGCLQARKITENSGETEGSRRSIARAVLEEGILEVDGRPNDGRPRRNPGYWDEDELEEGLTDLSRGTR